MDKLKAQLAPVLQHWFWITAGLVMLGSLGIWWMASGKLISEFESQRSKIESNATTVKGVNDKINEHPNPKTHEEMERLIKARKKSVLDAWTSVYKRQQDILVWPVAELKEDLVREFRDLIPIEVVPFPTLDAEKETSLLNRYRYYIGNVLPGIAEIAKTKWEVEFDRPSGPMGMAPPTPSFDTMPMGPNGIPKDDGPLVKWDPGSQQSLMTDLFPWRGGQPTTLQVLYSQENLWILRQMMQIIASVNGDAGQRFQAKIHEINRIAIGSSVKTSAGIISRPSLDSAGGMMGGEAAMNAGAEMAAAASAAAMNGGGGFGGGEELDPGDNRYVDTAGKPLPASSLRAALSSNSPTDAFMAVAKRVPVMMTFKMDQRAVPDLIAKCGSAPLMIEVRQVRILPNSSGIGGMPGGMPAGMPGGMMGGGIPGMDMAGMGGMPSATDVVREQFPLDLEVEIYGIIYIYNPPIEEKLGVEKVNEETVVEGTAMADGRKVDVPVAAAPPVAAEPLPPAVAPNAANPSVDAPLPATGIPPVGNAATPAEGAFWMPRKPLPNFTINATT